MFAGIRFLWNATRGHHLTPWKSEYVRWRMETYSGMHAEDINAAKFFSFLLREKSRLFHFLLWTIRMSKVSAESGSRN